MKRRSMLAAGVALGAETLAVPTAVWAAPAPRLSAGDVAAARRLLAAGDYARLDRVLPLLLNAAARSADQGPAGAGRAADVWVLASHLAVRQGRTEAAGVYAARAGAAATRSGDAVVLAAAARAAATPLRRTGRTDAALHLLQEALAHLTASPRPTAAELDAAGMAGLTAAYTAAQAHQCVLAEDLAAQAEQTARRLASLPHTGRRPRQLTAGQCLLYRIGIHRHLGDLDAALAHARRLQPETLPTAERRARAATDTARTLLDAGDTAAASASCASSSSPPRLRPAAHRCGR